MANNKKYCAGCGCVLGSVTQATCVGGDTREFCSDQCLAKTERAEFARQRRNSNNSNNRGVPKGFKCW